MDDFHNTAKRMWEDASVLNSGNRWFGTCYFSGYVLECYGKLVIETFLGTSGQAYRHDLGNINTALQGLVVTNPIAAKYCIDLNVKCATIYTGSQEWHPNNRYSCSAGFWDSQNVAQSFLDEAKEVRDIIIQMELDGVI